MPLKALSSYRLSFTIDDSRLPYLYFYTFSLWHIHPTRKGIIVWNTAVAAGAASNYRRSPLVYGTTSELSMTTKNAGPFCIQHSITVSHISTWPITMVRHPEVQKPHSGKYLNRTLHLTGMNSLFLQKQAGACGLAHMGTGAQKNTW